MLESAIACAESKSYQAEAWRASCPAAPRRFFASVGLRHGDWRDFDLRDAFVAVDSHLLGGRRRQIHDAALNIGTSIPNGHDRALAGLDVGDLRGRAQRQRLARGTVVVRVHAGAVRHLPAAEFPAVEGRLAEARASAEVEPGVWPRLSGMLRDGLLRG